MMTGRSNASVISHVLVFVHRINAGKTVRIDEQVRQGIRQAFQSVLRDLRVPERNEFQPMKTSERSQPPVRDSGPREIQMPECRQPAEFVQMLIGEIAVGQVQGL